MRARRALLYMPGDDLRKITKAASLDVDCVCLDLEDAVALNRKLQARETTTEALRSMDFGRSERLARINAVGSGFEQADLLAVLSGNPDAIVIPKVENGEQIRWASGLVAEYEQSCGRTIGEIPILAIVESARAILNLIEIVTADPRLEGIIFGADDFAGDIGATRTRDALEVFFARSAVVTHAAAYGLQAIDMVFVDFHDPEGLFREAQDGAQLGFTGKQIIHPSQVEPVQRAFTPSDESIEFASKLMQEYTAHQQAGVGAFALEGKMIDAPMIRSARRVLDRARAAGKVQST